MNVQNARGSEREEYFAPTYEVFTFETSGLRQMSGLPGGTPGSSVPGTEAPAPLPDITKPQPW